MKIGINRWFGYDISADESFKLIKEAGFDNVLLWWGDEFEQESGKKELLPEKARNNGLYIENVHVPFSRANTLWENTPESEDALQEFFSCVEACGQYEIPTMVFHLTCYIAPPKYNQFGLDKLKRLADAAEKFNVNIALENLRYPKYIDYVLDNIDSEKLKLCYDTGHENCFSETDMLEKYKGRLAALHLHDNDGSDDQHMIPGDGTIDWDIVASKLLLTNFDGAVTLECANNGHDLYKNFSPEDFLAKSYASAVKIAKMLEKEQ